MATFTRRQLFERGAKVAFGVAAISVPEALYRSPWTRLAAAQTLPTTEAAFTAAVEAITTAADVATARWVMREFDRALPPLPDQVAVTAAVAALLDARTVAGAHAPTFALATPDQRRRVLADMVGDADPTVRQIANQLIPFCAFGYWSDATLAAPAVPGDPGLQRWERVGFPGPSHGYADTYTDDGPPGFRPMRGFQR